MQRHLKAFERCGELVTSKNGTWVHWHVSRNEAGDASWKVGLGTFPFASQPQYLCMPTRFGADVWRKQWSAIILLVLELLLYLFVIVWASDVPVHITGVNISSGRWVASHPKLWTLIGVVSPSEVGSLGCLIAVRALCMSESAMWIYPWWNWLFSLVSVSSFSILVQWTDCQPLLLQGWLHFTGKMFIIYLEISLKVTLLNKNKTENPQTNRKPTQNQNQIKKFFRTFAIPNILLKPNTTAAKKHKSLKVTLLSTSCLLLPQVFVILHAQLLYTCKF